jgi:hypothetical protein
MVAQRPREVTAEVLWYHTPGEALGSMVPDEHVHRVGEAAGRPRTLGADQAGLHEKG